MGQSLLQLYLMAYIGGTLYKIFLHLTVLFQCIWEGEVAPPPLHSLLRSVLFFSLAKGVSSEDSLISSHISDLGANKPN